MDHQRLPTITEAAFAGQVIRLAQLNGWIVAHFRPAMTKRGWRTAVSGNGKGFPDLVLLRLGIVLVVELKVGRNKLTVEQDKWLSEWRAADVMVRVWRPEDWPEIERTLGRE